jgi:hypothetical protein
MRTAAHPPVATILPQVLPANADLGAFQRTVADKQRAKYREEKGKIGQQKTGADNGLAGTASARKFNLNEFFVILTTKIEFF